MSYNIEIETDPDMLGLYIGNNHISFETGVRWMGEAKWLQSLYRITLMNYLNEV
jgi:predicted Zn-dependent protease with MMP-like domain